MRRCATNLKSAEGSNCRVDAPLPSAEGRRKLQTFQAKGVKRCRCRGSLSPLATVHQRLNRGLDAGGGVG